LVLVVELEAAQTLLVLAAAEIRVLVQQTQAQLAVLAVQAIQQF
jgi:hypothetical protein